MHYLHFVIKRSRSTCNARQTKCSDAILVQDTRISCVAVQNDKKRAQLDRNDSCMRDVVFRTMNGVPIFEDGRRSTQVPLFDFEFETPVGISHRVAVLLVDVVANVLAT